MRTGACRFCIVQAVVPVLRKATSSFIVRRSATRSSIKIENAHAGTLKLNDDDLTAIDRAFPPPHHKQQLEIR